jgi:molecular chaperone GrpE
MQLLPMADYFQHAFDQVPEAEKKSSWLEGIKHIQNYFNKILQDNDVQEIKALGEKFNPEIHEVVKEEESEQEEGKIIKVNQAGFTLQGKVIRPAKVIISKKSAYAKASAGEKGGEKK